MSKQGKASPGSISTGTLKSTDLVTAFLNHLETLDEAEAAEQEAILRDDIYDAVMADGDVDVILIEKVDTLADVLNEYAPAGHHFGAHEGDGADFGFWPDEDDNEDVE